MQGEIKKGDRLKVTILDCYAEAVSTTSRGRFLHLGFWDQDGRLNVGPLPLSSDHLKIEALTPHTWPPCRGDVWEDGHGVKWFGVCPIDENKVTLFSVRGSYPASGVDELLLTNGPWRLVYRDEAEPPF
ncbi:hypothetical protein [Nonomuraea lactucae]|uniref:hypothetical protein n=1 Tax=Nonomuraea lactucae TaxID=2249762 RepID=UPI000DE203C8|nr:hypothetical protein [Nonomuraea lactucae]